MLNSVVEFKLLLILDKVKLVMGKAINIEYGIIDFENDIIETVTST